MSQVVQIVCVHVNTLLIRLESSGVPTGSILTQFGLTSELFLNPVTPVPLELFNQVSAHCEALTGDPLFALHASRYSTGEEYGWGKYATIAQPDIRTVLREGMKLWSKMATPFDASFFESEGVGGVRLELKQTHGPFLDRYTEMELALVVAATNLCAGIPVAVREVHFAHVPRAPKTAYQEALDCPIHFGAEVSMILYDSDRLALPTQIPDENLRRLAMAEVNQMIEMHYSEGFDLITRVKKMLHLAESAEAWRLKTAADALHLAPRTLQHQLKQAGTSYELLVDTIRREKSVIYLEQGVMQEEISYRLGYADVGGFRKAFRRWFAAPPGEWRRHRNEGGASLSS